MKLAAFVEVGDEDAQFTNGEQESPAKGRFRQPSVCQMEEDLLEKTDFLYRKSVLYHYNDRYYESINAEGVVSLYRQYISPGLDGVKNLRNHLDIYKCMKANPRLKYEDSLKDKPYCPLKNGILYLNNTLFNILDSKTYTSSTFTASCCSCNKYTGGVNTEAKPKIGFESFGNLLVASGCNFNFKVWNQ